VYDEEPHVRTALGGEPGVVEGETQAPGRRAGFGGALQGRRVRVEGPAERDAIGPFRRGRGQTAPVEVGGTHGLSRVVRDCGKLTVGQALDFEQVESDASQQREQPGAAQRHHQACTHPWRCNTDSGGKVDRGAGRIH
jgi:hypothetical protein